MDGIGLNERCFCVSGPTNTREHNTFDTKMWQLSHWSTSRSTQSLIDYTVNSFTARQHHQLVLTWTSSWSRPHLNMITSSMTPRHDHHLSTLEFTYNRYFKFSHYRLRGGVEVHMSIHTWTSCVLTHTCHHTHVHMDFMCPNTNTDTHMSSCTLSSHCVCVSNTHTC